MDALNPGSALTLGAMMLLAVAIATAAALRLARARSRERQRVVEQPNSHYTSPLVRSAETRNRWRGMRLDAMHEINRAEVERLLAKVDAGGADALKDAERSFLDYMASLDSASRGPDVRPPAAARPASGTPVRPAGETAAS